MNLSQKSYTELFETIKSYYDSDGEDGELIANDCIADLKCNQYSFELWDALGSDELGFVQSNKELKNLYCHILNNWSHATKNKKSLN